MKSTTQKSLIAVSCLAALLTLGACNKADDRTAGQQLDSAIAKTDAAGERAKDQMKDATASAGAAMSNAADATKTAGANAVDGSFDAMITAKVNTGLAADKDLSAIKINVDTKDGVVTLSGPAPTAAAKERAAEIAKNVQDVKSVNNNLVVGS
jgi:hyperosmotically inducible protein